MADRKNAGFTLIELLIVVVIIGILAAIAIPAYQDYIARSQVSEAMSLTSGTKTPIAEYWADRGSWPTLLSNVSQVRSGKYVSFVTISTGAGKTSGSIIIQATFRAAGVSSGIRSSTFAIETTDGAGWDCGNVDGADTSTNLQDKHLPGACK